MSFFREKLKTYFISSRPWSFSASFSSVLLGTALAWRYNDSFAPLQFLLTTIAVLSIHAAGNFVNTLYDYENGFDTEVSDDTTLVRKVMEPQEVRKCIRTCYEIGALSFALICLTANVPYATISLLFSVGALSAFWYTGGIGLKYLALGDLVIFSVFAPLVSMFAYVVQTGEYSLQVMAVSLPLAFNIEAILHGNNIRDIENDKKSGAVTVAILLGKNRACALYSFLLVFPYVLLVIIALVCMSGFCLLPLLTIPVACRLNSNCRHGNTATIPQQTAQMNLIFGILYVCGCVFAA